jgi:hypothetical protein
MRKKPAKSLFQYFLLLSLISASKASAMGSPEVRAYEAAIEATAQIFSSPALPSLDNDGASISPIYGTVKMEGQNEIWNSSTTGDYRVENNGEIRGEVAGLAYNYSGKGDFGFFATAAWSRVEGDMVSSSPTESFDLRDITAQNYVGVFGVNYRAVGTDKSFFALGFFGGPAFISAKTSSRIVYLNGTSTKVTLNPDTSALYLGMQMMFRKGNFRLNPYVNILGNTNMECYKPTYEGAPYVAAQHTRCSNGETGVSTVAVLAGAGLNVGYGRLNFGLWSVAGGANGSLKSTPLIFSLRIGL